MTVDAQLVNWASAESSGARGTACDLT
jgi:hypothetical protein